MRVSHLRHGALVAALAGSVLSAPAAIGQINYGNFSGTGVDFVQVTESSGTDTLPLLQAPELSPAGDQLLFFPTAFLSSCAAGTSDVTASQLTMTIMTSVANAIETVSFGETGDSVLVKFPPFGDPTTNATASLSGSLTVTEDTGGPIAPVVIPFSGTFTPTNAFALPGDFGASVWSASFSIDVAAQVPNATKAELTLTQTLASNCGAGSTSAKIQSNVMSGPLGIVVSAPPTAVPAMGRWGLLLTVCGLFGALTFYLLRRRTALVYGGRR